MSNINAFKEYSTSQIRNIALIGHGGSGKTSFSEAVLFSTDKTTRQGTIQEGNTISDYHPDEIERKISINTSLLVTELENAKINIFDTPGYNDFTGEVKSSLFVADTALLFIKAFEGIEVGTEIVWEYVKEFYLPALFLISKIDHDNAEYENVLKSIKEKLTNDATIITFPVNSGHGFDAVVDVVKMKMLKFIPHKNGKYIEEEIPAEFIEKAKALHEELIEKIAESDEVMLNKFFEHGTLHDDEITVGMRDAMEHRKLYPVFAVSSTSNVGALNIAEFVARYSPAPNERPAVKAIDANTKKEVEVKIDDKKETSLYIFKTVSEAHVGELSFFKVFTGMALHGQDLMNEANGKPERLGQIFIMNGKERFEMAKIHSGDIGTVVKLKDSHTTNTLSSKSYPIIFSKIPFPAPVISLAIHPKAKGEEDKVGQGLHVLHEEDPTFEFKIDNETHETVISGQGELHLEIVVRRLKQKFGVDVEISEPKIAYRETIKSKTLDSEYKHKKQSGGRGQFGHVHLKIEPNERGKGFEFINEIVGGVVPGRFIPAVEKGLVDTISQGIIAGFKVVDVKVTLFDGSFHDVDSDEISFKIAGSQAFRKGFKEARPILLEPIYIIEVIVPDEYMGEVMGDISSRRGKILGMESDGSHQIIKGQVALKDLYRYSTTLRSMSQGRGIHKQKFSHYEEVPREIAEKIVAEYEKLRQEEHN
ncbi:MAG: elongation factor G [Bacteroidota bacterium]